MCSQCAATGAVAATAAATGLRAWLGVHAHRWLPAGARRVLGVLAIAAGLLAAGLLA